MRRTAVALALGVMVACTGGGGATVASSPAAATDIGLLRQQTSSCSYAGIGQPNPAKTSNVKLADLNGSGFNVHLWHLDPGYQYPDWAAGFLVSHATLTEHAHIVAHTTVKPNGESSLAFKFPTGAYGILCVPLKNGSEYGVGYTAGPIITSDLPLPRGYHAMADAAGSGVVIYGGETAGPRLGGVFIPEVWEYDHAAAPTWRKQATASVSAQGDNLVCVDDCSRVLWWTGKATWELDVKTNQWRKKSAPAHALHGMRAVYDTESRRVIAFGGDYGDLHPVDETWAYDPSTDTWTQMHPETSPPGRFWQAMAYDAASDRVVVFGGEGTVDEYGDTWAYDFNHDGWARLSADGGPTERHYTAMVYDAAAKRMVLFGGADANEAPLGDTWLFAVQTGLWTEVKAPGPSARAWHAMAFDAESQTVVLFGGGTTRGTFLNDVWLFSSSTGTWSRG